MRDNVDPLDAASTDLDPKISQIYTQASQIRDSLRASVPETTESPQRRRTRELAREVLAIPEKLRSLVAEGRVEEARAAWELPRRLLVTWQEKGVGGDDVGRLLEEGDGILEGANGSGGSSRSGSGSGSGRSSGSGRPSQS